MAAAPRGFEIAQVDQGIIRSHHPKEEWAGLSVTPRESGKAGLTARGLARVLPPAHTPRAPGSPWWPRAGCPPPRPFSRGRLGRSLPPSPAPHIAPCPRKSSCRRLGRNPPQRSSFWDQPLSRFAGWRKVAEQACRRRRARSREPACLPRRCLPRPLCPFGRLILLEALFQGRPWGGLDFL